MVRGAPAAQQVNLHQADRVDVGVPECDCALQREVAFEYRLVLRVLEDGVTRQLELREDLREEFFVQVA